MAFGFGKKPAHPSAQELEIMRTRRAELASQLTAAETNVAKLQEEIEVALIGGAHDNPKLEAEQAAAERHVSKLAAAIATLDTKIDKVEEGIAREDREQRAEKEIAALDNDWKSFTDLCGDLLATARKLQPLADRLGAHLFDVNQIAGLVRALSVDVPVHTVRAAEELRFVKSQITERAKQAPRKVAIAPQATTSPAAINISRPAMPMKATAMQVEEPAFMRLY